MAFSKAKYSLSILTKSSISLDKLLIPFFIDRYHFSPNVNKGTPGPYSFRRTFHKDTIMRVIFFVMVDREGVFVVGIEWKSAFFALMISYNWVSLSEDSDIFDRLEEFNEACLRGISSGWHIQIEHMLQTFLPFDL